MLVLSTITSLLFFLLPSSSATPDPEEDVFVVPRVKTSSGILQGFAPQPDVHAYVGIRYAQPPVGPLRFEPPVPYRANDTDCVVEAYHPFSSCFQRRGYTVLVDKISGYRESEDCLFLNVWKPAKASEHPLPVFIWIYGGSHVEGGTNQWDGIDVVQDTQDIIFVSMNYRLNVFGFPFDDGVSGKNAGLRDVRLAIEWVRENIAAFGGDPQRLIAVGESAGSVSVSNLAYAYSHDPIVAGLIQMSGQIEIQPPNDGLGWSLVLNNTGCSGATSELDCLKNVPARALKRALSPSNLLDVARNEPFGGTPTVDNETVFTAEEYIRRGLVGEFAPIPILISNTRREGDLLADIDPYLNPPINRTFSDEFTTLGFHCPAALASNFRAIHGIPVYRFVFSGTFPELTPYPEFQQAWHAEDSFLWLAAEKYIGFEDLGPDVIAAGKYMRRAFSAFAHDPVDGLKQFGWPEYNPKEPTLVDLFPKNTSEVEFIDPKAYDLPCQAIYPGLLPT